MKYPEADKRILLIGIGNSGRGDDGLGWKFAEAANTRHGACVDVEYRYQLQVEDAALITEYDVVVFADASYDQYTDGFKLMQCVPDQQASFTSHALAPGAIVYLANQLFNRYPAVWTLAISGSNWGLGATISETSAGHLASALRYFEEDFLPSILKPVETANEHR